MLPMENGTLETSEQSLPQVQRPTNYSIVVPDISNNTHKMVTRSKSRITKPWVFSATAVDEPTSVSEESEQSPWKNAMNIECQALLRNGTWSLFELHMGFHTKYNVYGSLNKHKAQLVAKDFINFLTTIIMRLSVPCLSK